MRRVLLAVLILVFAFPATAAELLYQWNKGDVHRFHYEGKSTMQVSMPGMPAMGGMGIQMPGMQMGGGGISTDVEVQTDFLMKVLSVDAAGNADMELVVEKLTVLGGGKVIATLETLPEAARVGRATLDRKGRAVFKRITTVYFEEERIYVAVRADENGVTASGGVRTQDGEVYLNTAASVDRKTGKVSVSASLSDRKAPAVKVKEDTSKLDALPMELFELMVLPEGNMQPGSEASVRTPVTTMTTTLASLKGEVATLKMSSHTDTSKVTQMGDTSGAGGGDDDEEADEDEDEEGGAVLQTGLGVGMGLDPFGGAAGDKKVKAGRKPEGSGAGDEAMPSTKMTVDLMCQFDVSAGRLMRVEGSSETGTDMGGGGSTKVASTFVLVRAE